MPETIQQRTGGGGMRFSLWISRVLVAVILGVALILQAGRIDGTGTAAIYAASWIVFLHVLIGEYVFIHYLHAVSRVQQLLDAFAAVLLLGGIFSFQQSALWCAFLAGAFALAITKYLLVEQHIENLALKRYAREKILWESPAVCLFSVLALLIDRLPAGGVFVQMIELVILGAVALFAFWMIGVRHLYRHVAQSQKKHGLMADAELNSPRNKKSSG